MMTCKSKTNLSLVIEFKGTSRADVEEGMPSHLKHVAYTAILHVEYVKHIQCEALCIIISSCIQQPYRAFRPLRDPGT